ncbi:MAG: 6,7-dimethyl-8-ribityllumazine synthase [Polyangiaceae bacterium]|nr:6,7-dimethyl-8-ribityllumazine synthase [Polyangiaceae bacterium]
MGENTAQILRPGVRVLEGNLVVPEGARFAIVASRFNAFIVDRLIEGAVDALLRHGAAAERITLVRSPGSWELPLVVSRIAEKGDVNAIIALGALIRGSTAHFEYIAGEVAKGLAHVSLKTGLPVTFGVLTTDNLEQAIDRAGTKSGNKGAEAATAAIELVSLGRALEGAGWY